jgi:phenylacetate-CoA ligase
MTPAAGLKVASYVAFLLRSQWWSSEQIASYQRRRLIGMMRHAVSSIPYYGSLGIKPESITSPEDIGRFPYLTKPLLQARMREFLLPSATLEDLYVSRTSGSSGQPTTTYFSAESWLFSKYALKARRVLAATNPVRKRFLIVVEKPPGERPPRRAGWRRPPAWPLGGLVRFRWKSIYDDMVEHAELVGRYRPDVIYAFPSYLIELLHLFEDRRRPVPRIPVLMTSSEVLTRAMRERLETGFRSRVFDVYGSTEFKEVAWQCAHGTYHVNFESVFVETRPIPDDAGGGQALVISDLRNTAMPLLRYDLEDRGLVRHESCPCGRRSPQLGEISGREAQTLVLPDGSRVFPYVLTQAIERVEGIRRYQIVHVTPAQVRLDVVPSESGPGEETLSALCGRLEELLARRVQVTARRVGAIPRGAGGKHAVVVRAFPPAAGAGERMDGDDARRS